MPLMDTHDQRLLEYLRFPLSGINPVDLKCRPLLRYPQRADQHKYRPITITGSNGHG